MISKMRTWAPAIMVIILITFVVGTIFLNWGANRGSGASRMQAAGKINGREIPLTYFDRAVNNERQQMEKSGSAQDQSQSYQIPRQMWEKEVNRVLMGNFFQKAGMEPSADEVFDYIKHHPLPGIDTASVFMTNGVFDTAKFGAFLSNPNTYDRYPIFRQIEQYAREMLPVQKLEMLLSAPLVPSKAELEYEYRAQHEKCVFEYAYVNGPAIKIDESRVTDDMIAKYYAAHRDTFKTNDQVDLYMVKFAKKATPRDDQVYFQEMTDLRTKLMSEKSVSRVTAFADEAKISSDDESNSQNGGDLGWLLPGTKMPDFDSAAFKLDSGAISSPVKTELGYHLIMVEKKEKNGKVVRIKARHILRKIVPTMETVDILNEKADSLSTQMKDIGFLAAARAAAKRDPSIIVDSTGLFERGTVMPGIGYISGLGRFVYGHESQDKNAISERLENTGGVYLFAVKQRIAKGILPLEAAKQRIRLLLTDSLRHDAVRAYAEGWIKKIGDNATLADLKKSDSIMIGSGVTDSVTRASYVPGIGSDTKVTAVAFALPVGKRSGLIEYIGTYFIVRPLWKGPAVSVPWGSPEITMLANQTAEMIKQRIYIDWYLQYKSRAKIVSNIDKIYFD
jgi:peptidyl-prolyl cis-trans isomerase D